MFFKSIEQHLVGMNLNIVISKNETGLVVSVFPQLTCKDEAKGNITPILLKGTAEELDAQFAGIIQQPLQKVSGISTNLIQFERAVEKTEADNAITKAKKDESKKLTDKADKFLDEADKLIKEDKIPAAVLKIEAALKIAPEYKKALDLLAKHKAETAPDIFAVVEEVKADPIIEKAQEELVKTGEPQIIDEANILVQTNQGPALATPETISPEKQEKVEAFVAPVDVVVAPVVVPVVADIIPEVKLYDNNPEGMKPTIVENIVVAPQVSQITSDNKPVSLAGTPKPTRMDMEPMEEYIIRLNSWLVFNPETIADNPAATQPSATPIEEPKSDMQEMAEEEQVQKEMRHQEMLQREKDFNAEVKAEAPIAPASNNIEILG